MSFLESQTQREAQFVNLCVLIELVEVEAVADTHEEAVIEASLHTKMTSKLETIAVALITVEEVIFRIIVIVLDFTPDIAAEIDAHVGIQVNVRARNLEVVNQVEGHFHRHEVHLNVVLRLCGPLSTETPLNEQWSRLCDADSLRVVDGEARERLGMAIILEIAGQVLQAECAPTCIRVLLNHPTISLFY